jgi:pyruvate dehydrogenase E2 component (dihydrolipoamide acetyltransferase)
MSGVQYVFQLPDLGEGLLDAKVIEWRVAVGDEVERDGPLAEVETEKAAVELPSPVAGRVLELHAGPGETVEVGRPLVTFEVADQPGIVGAVPHDEPRERRVRLRLPEDEG